MIYHVAYPNPSLRPKDRVCRCGVDSETDRKGLLSQLYEEYPDHTEDLKHASIWKVIRLSLNHPMLCLQQAPQAIDLELKKADACDESLQKVYEWIGNIGEDSEILRGDCIVEYFPDGPHDRALRQVDIVVITPESMSLYATPNRSFNRQFCSY